MPTYVPAPPSGALACGSGQLAIQGANEAAALLIAKNGAGAYVTAQVNAAFQTAVRGSPELLQKVGAMKRRQVLYTLGKGAALPDSAWYFPFHAYVRDRA